MLAYEVIGHGRPLVLLHPFPFDGTYWRDTAARLQDGAQIITPDLRGFGKSQLGTHGFSIDDLADDVAALLDTLGHATAIVGGLSMGGYVSLAFAARHAARLSGLILADTKADLDSPPAKQARTDAMELVRTAGVNAYLDKQLPRLLAAGAAQVLQRQVRALAQQPPASVIAGFEALRDRPDRASVLASVRVPALVIVGALDVITPPQDAHAMANALPHCRLVEIPHVGHLANLEAPAAFSTAVQDFLASVRA